MSAEPARPFTPDLPPVLAKLAISRGSGAAAIRDLHEQHDSTLRLSRTLVGKRVAIVGKHTVPKAQLVERVQRCGGVVATKFGPNTDALVVGAEPPAKELARAAREGVLVIGADELDQIARARQTALGQDSRVFRKAVENARNEAKKVGRPGSRDEAPPPRPFGQDDESLARQVEELARMRTRDSVR